MPGLTGAANFGTLAGVKPFTPEDLLACYQRGVFPMAESRDDEVMAQQLQLSLDAVREAKRPVDLVVWPETMFRQPLVMLDEVRPAAAESIGSSKPATSTSP